MLALLKTTIQARLQRQEQVNLSLLEVAYNRRKHHSWMQPWSTQTWEVGFPARKPELLPARLLLWENSEVGAGQRLATLHRLCSCLSKMLQSNARKSSACLAFYFFFSVGDDLRVPLPQPADFCWWSFRLCSKQGEAGLKGWWQACWFARGL